MIECTTRIIYFLGIAGIVVMVRDDAGHSSSAITDRYVDIELRERAKSAKNKPMDMSE